MYPENKCKGSNQAAFFLKIRPLYSAGKYTSCMLLGNTDPAFCQEHLSVNATYIFCQKINALYSERMMIDYAKGRKQQTVSSEPF